MTTSDSRLTKKQWEIMTLIHRGAPDDGHGLIDVDQLLSSLSWNATKPSLQFSLRSLISRNLVRRAETEVRRGRRRRLLTLTLEGQRWFDPLGDIVELN